MTYLCFNRYMKQLLCPLRETDVEIKSCFERYLSHLLSPIHRLDDSALNGDLTLDTKSALCLGAGCDPIYTNKIRT